MGAMLPEFVTKTLGIGGGGSGSVMVDLVVDEERKLMYTLSVSGLLTCHHVPSPTKTTPNPPLSILSCTDTIRGSEAYCKALSRNPHGHFSSQSPHHIRMIPASLSGVGSTEAALALAGDAREAFGSHSLHVVSSAESSRLLLVVVTSGGCRLHYAGGDVRGGFTTGLPTNLTLVYIRAPAGPEAAWGPELAPAAAPTPDRLRASPTYVRGRPTTGTVHGALRCPDGTCVAAVETEGEQRDAGGEEGVKLTVTIPDSTRHGVGDHQGREMLVAGGTNEICGAARPHGRLGLPGRVWDMAVLPNEDPNNLWGLHVASGTPLDVEINRTLPPPVLPKKDTVNKKNEKKSSSGILGGLFVSRKRSAYTSFLEKPKQPPRNYQLDFSPTSLPKPTPLIPTATHHLAASPQSTTFCALTNGGLFFFRTTSILEAFRHDLSTRDEAAMSTLIRSLGRVEACAAALTLAVGEMNESTGGLAEKAIRVAFRAKGVPELVHTEPAESALGDMYPQPQQIFRHSSLHDGLALVLSRLLRPIWFKQAVVVSLPKPAEKNRSAKVNLLLSSQNLDAIRRPLANLTHLMRRFFPSATKRDALSTSEDHSSDLPDPSALYATAALRDHADRRARETPTPSSAHAACLRREDASLHLLYRLASRTVQLLSLLDVLCAAHKQHVEGGGLAEVEWGLLHGATVRDLVVEKEAHGRVQRLLLSLVTGAASTTPGGGESNKIVADRLASALGKQCYLYFSDGARLSYEGFRVLMESRRIRGVEARRQMGKEATGLLCRAARHWKSPRAIMGITTPSGDETSPLIRAAEKLAAIDYYEGIVDISLSCASNFGGTAKGTLSYEREYSRNGAGAMENVDSNHEHMLEWEVGLYHNDSEAEPDRIDLGSTTALDINRSTSDVTSSLGGLTANSCMQIVPVGEDEIDLARSGCYNCILNHLEILLLLALPVIVVPETNGTNPNVFLQQMLNAALASGDVQFHYSLYDFLLEKKEIDRVINVQSPYIESYLLARDVELLWRHHVMKGNHARAVKVMSARAHDETNGLSLDERVECLNRAAGAARDATMKDSVNGRNGGDQSTGQSGFMSWDKRELNNPTIAEDRQSREILSELKLTLDTANIQRRLLDSLKDTNHDGKCIVPADVIHALSSKLVDVSTLFNDIAAKYDYWEICLLILHVCKHKDTEDYIDTLWRAIVTKEIPTASGSRDTRTMLANLRKKSPASNFENESSLFEDGAWIVPLRAKVSGLGRELYGTGADYVFPLPMLTDLLEELRRAFCELSTSAGERFGFWPMLTMVDAGVPSDVLVETYKHLLHLCESRGGDSNQRQHLSDCIQEITKRNI